MSKGIFVAFITKKLRRDFELLKSGKFEDKKLYGSIEKAKSELKNDPQSGTKIQKDRWPKVYIKKYGLTNLWKFDLPNGWRLIYTIDTDEVRIVNIILEWFDHKSYNKKFKYNVK